MTRIEVPNSAPRRKSSRRGIRILILFLVLVCVCVGLWTWLTLAWAYSDGERAGVLQKFARRGWLCKTQEGEIAQYLVAGISPQMWSFSVRDPAVVAQLQKAVGHRVQLHYTEHPGVPTECFAETRFYVDRVTVTDDQSGSGTGGIPGITPAPGTAPLPGTGATPVTP